MQTKTQDWELVSKAKPQVNVDCIKLCPFDQKLFAFAYYQQSQTFLGGVSLQYYCHDDKSNQLVQKFNILECGPVLHICWLNKKIEGNYVLVGASRSQKIIFFSVKIDDQSKQPTIHLQKQIFIQKEVFCLYVDCWMRAEQQFEVIVSTNQSHVFQLSIDSNFEQKQQLKTFSKHQYAVWTCRLNPFSSKTQFACGDQVRSIYLYNQNGLLIGKNSTAHEQGICDLVFINQHKMYSGGFDGFVNQFDLNNFHQPIRTFQLGGTIWRIIPHNNQLSLLICNSSEKKFQIIDALSGQQLWYSQSQHGSLAYAADWNQKTLLTSSFYDQVVCLWTK